MRQLKFRVWNTLKRTFESSSDIAINGNGILLITKTGYYKDFINVNYISSCEEYIIQQYTGFTDRNGKDVYEGDIFRSEGAYKWAAVEFMDGKFVVALMGARVYDLCELFEVDYDKPEVIGNIFENTELLK